MGWVGESQQQQQQRLFLVSVAWVRGKLVAGSLFRGATVAPQQQPNIDGDSEKRRRQPETDCDCLRLVEVVGGNSADGGLRLH